MNKITIPVGVPLSCELDDEQLLGNQCMTCYGSGLEEDIVESKTCSRCNGKGFIPLSV